MPSSLTTPDAMPPRVRIAKGAYRLSALQRFLVVFLVLAAALSILYLCFAVTILRVLPGSNMGFVPVKNTTYTGGVVPPGHEVIVNTKSAEPDSVISNARQALLPDQNVARVRVLAGPYGALQVQGHSVRLGTQRFTLNNLQGLQGNYLQGQYIVRCVQGACAPGSTFLLAQNHVYGDPLEKSGA